MKRNKNSTACKFKIGSNIRKWRNIKDIKQKDLAFALQISEAAVSNIENDVSNITVGQLEEISIALNISIEQLLSDPQDKFRIHPASAYAINEEDDQRALDKELINAIISSMEKKDQQLQVIMQHFLHAMALLMQEEKLIFNSSKQVTSRA
ncbi:MAG: helix-turn-helix transcriptional regulator [Ferruginibacter sp.]